MRYGHGGNSKKWDKIFAIFLAFCIIVSFMSLIFMLVIHWFGDYILDLVKDLSVIKILMLSGTIGVYVFIGGFAIYYLIGILLALGVWIQEILSYIIAVFRFLFFKHK